jgi:ribosomal protein S2
MGSVLERLTVNSGVQFGHQARKWNPKTTSYIFTEHKVLLCHFADSHFKHQGLVTAYQTGNEQQLQP